MDNYSYNYRPDNLANSIQYIHQNYYNNISNSYQFYGLNAFDKENFIDYNDNNYPQTLFSRNNSHSLYLEEGKDFDVVNVKNIKKSILNAPNSKNHSKAPKDNNKIPQDSKKAKYNNDTINKYQFKPSNNNFNNITTINNNNYNKINSINIIFDANNIYNNNDNKNYIKYNNFNDIGFMENNYNKRMNLLKNENNKLKIEKQPKDNFKNYTDSVSQMNNFINNNKLIRLKKNEGKELFDKNNSYNISNNKNNYPKNSESNKIENENKNKNKNKVKLKIKNESQQSK